MEVIDAHRTAAVLPDLAQHVQAQHARIAESPPTVGQEARAAFQKIVAEIGSDLPTAMDLMQQGEFAIGYYEQRALTKQPQSDGE